MEIGNSERITQIIGFIGGGNMAKAIFDGIVSKKLVDTNQVFVSGPRIERLSYFKDQGVHIAENNQSLIKSCDVIFICVKPHVLETIACQINSPSIDDWHNKVFVSVLAATSLEKIQSCFVMPMKLIRVMPNTPLAVGEGCCVFTPKPNVEMKHINLVRSLLESSGLCLQVPENQINAIAAVSGSGPAFMYTIIEAMADGGVKMGIPRADAVKLAAQTMLGAAKMVLQSGKHSAQLKDEVCSAGGTTIAGIHALERGGVRSAMMDAVEASTKRAIEMECSRK